MDCPESLWIREPTVSVVMPTFDRADLVIAAARSIIGQTYANWEMLVIDDGSSDDTIERLAQFGEPRLKTIEVPHCGIVSRLRNIGVTASSGEYIAFLDSDDSWIPARLETQLRALPDDGRTWAFSDVALVDDQGRAVPMRSGQFRPVTGRITRELLLDETSAHIVTWLVPRRLFEDVGGFDETLMSHSDLDFAFRLSEVADAIGLPEVLAQVRDHPGRMTRGMPDPHQRAAMVFRKAAIRIPDPWLAKVARRRLAGHLASAGRNLIAAGDLREGGRLLWRSLSNGADPGHWLRSLASGMWHRTKRGVTSRTRNRRSKGAARGRARNGE